MTIKEIYHGKKVPVEERFTEDSEYVRLSSEWLRLEKEFISGLSEKQLADFNRLTDIQGEQAGISNERCYELGFKDGAQLILDIVDAMSE